jgi:hypothetical protein
MDVTRIISELHSELQEIDRKILILERTDIPNKATAYFVSETGLEPPDGSS